MAPSLRYLDRLGDELHVDQPSSPEFHVQPSRRLLAELLLHPPPQRAHLLKIGRRRFRPIHERADLAPRRPAHPRIAAHEARTGQGLALPRIRPLAIVPPERVEAR